MPRQPRLDMPGALHHVMGRGIDGLKIFGNRKDRVDFLARLKNLCEKEALSIYAWALMGNHFHLLVRTGKLSLSDSMRKLLTGYVVNYNRRHKRYGHLFQNRYKSILCEDDPYLLELTREGGRKGGRWFQNNLTRENTRNRLSPCPDNQDLIHSALCIMLWAGALTD